MIKLLCVQNIDYFAVFVNVYNVNKFGQGDILVKVSEPARMSPRYLTCSEGTILLVLLLSK